MYIIINEINGYIEKSCGNKYLTLASTNKNKDILKRHWETWDNINGLIRWIINNSGDYDEKYCKITLGEYTDKGKSWWAYIQGSWHKWELIFRWENTSICNLLNLFFFFFPHYKALISAFFTPCKKWNMLKINNKVPEYQNLTTELNIKTKGGRGVGGVGGLYSGI